MPARSSDHPIPSDSSPSTTAAPAQAVHGAIDAMAGPPTLALDGPQATLTLHRPQHHNRLHVEDLQTLQAHLQRVQAEPGLRVLLLRSGGPSFCSGFHLGSLGDTAEAAAADRHAGAEAGPRLFEQTVDALEALEVPTVCRIQGGVYGGAIDLALACDFRIGVRGTQARMPAARIGLHYYPSGLQRYVSRLGLGAAKRLFLLAETLDAPTLLALGVLDHLADDAAALDAECERRVQALASGAPLALRGMKASLNEVARGEFGLEAVRERVARCAVSQDLREGMAALAERREPRFTGR